MCIYKRGDLIIEFFLGICIYKIYRFSNLLNSYKLILLLILTFSLTITFLFISPQILKFKLLGLSSLILLFTLSERFIKQNNFCLNFLIILGNISFSTYLCHIPIFLLYQKIFQYNNIYIELIGLTCSTIIISYYSFRFIENNFLIRKLKEFNLSKNRKFYENLSSN